MTNWRDKFLRPGVQVVLVTRTAIIVRRLRYDNVLVRCDDGRIETWWRGNLRLVI